MKIVLPLAEQLKLAPDLKHYDYATIAAEQLALTTPDGEPLAEDVVAEVEKVLPLGPPMLIKLDKDFEDPSILFETFTKEYQSLLLRNDDKGLENLRNKLSQQLGVGSILGQMASKDQEVDSSVGDEEFIEV